MPAYSSPVKISLELAGREALASRHRFIYPLDLMCGLARLGMALDPKIANQLGVSELDYPVFSQEISRLMAIFDQAGVDPVTFRRSLRTFKTSSNYHRAPNDLHIPRAPMTRDLFERSMTLARQREGAEVNSFILLAALLEHPENWLPKIDPEINLSIARLKLVIDEFLRPLKLANQIEDLEQFTLDESITVESVENGRDKIDAKHLQLILKITRIVEQSGSILSLLERSLDALIEGFPKVNRSSIALGNEAQTLIPLVYSPLDKSFMSFSLADYAITSRQVSRWHKNVGKGNLSASLSPVGSVLYAPLVSKGEILGVLHLETDKSLTAFNNEEMLVAGLVSGILSPAIKLREKDPLPVSPTVFISYAREDSGFVDLLQADLRRYGIRVWFDRRLRGGEDWSIKIDEALEACTTLLLLMSENSVSSEYVMSEVQKAIDIGKTIIPLLYRPCIPPKIITNLQRIKIGHENYIKGLQYLISSIPKNS